MGGIGNVDRAVAANDGMAKREVFQIVNTHIVDQPLEVATHYRSVISSTDESYESRIIIDGFEICTRITDGKVFHFTVNVKSDVFYMGDALGEKFGGNVMPFIVIDHGVTVDIGAS